MHSQKAVGFHQDERRSLIGLEQHQGEYLITEFTFLGEPWKNNLLEKAINSIDKSRYHVMTIHVIQLFSTDYSCNNKMYSQYLLHFTKYKHYTSTKRSKQYNKLNIHRAAGPIGVSIKYKTAGIIGLNKS